MVWTVLVFIHNIFHFVFLNSYNNLHVGEVCCFWCFLMLVESWIFCCFSYPAIALHVTPSLYFIALLTAPRVNSTCTRRRPWSGMLCPPSVQWTTPLTRFVDVEQVLHAFIVLLTSNRKLWHHGHKYGDSLWPFIFFSLQAVDIKTSLFRMGRQLWWISAETGVTAIIWKARWDCYYLNCHHITPSCTDIFFVSHFYHDISVLFYRLFCRWSVNSTLARCIWLHW